MIKEFRLKEYNYEVKLGKVAQQADGSAWFKQGGTVILATVISAPTSEFPGFLPLTVEFREQFAAAGKIPGGYFKREGRLTDKEILTARLIDRTIRPLFPANYFNQIQVVVTVYSVDKEHIPNTISLLAASIALSISKIPFLGPVGVVEVARVEGRWILNPKYSETLISDVNIIVSGTKEGITMVEGSTNEISEDEFINVLFMAHEKIREQIVWQEKIQKEWGVKKEEIVDEVDWKEWTKKLEDFLTEEQVKKTFIPDKVERSEAIKKIKKAFTEQYAQEIEEQNISEKILEYIFENALKDKLTVLILQFGKRIDGRAFDEVRQISTQVGLLPYTHGSALFTRGRTQALATITLGGGQDAQEVEDLMGNTIERLFMLHYNFPSFSIGEVRPSRGPGRREIGHGYLARSALEHILPSNEKFPYTIRLVADILESDGSSSMATVSSGTMALMNAGVPIRKMVSGVAMGLLGRPDKGEFKALTDISGIEDAFGLMDFKVAGTQDGITAIQMDIKYKGGLSREIFEQALEQAKAARTYILKEMQKVMSEPNPKLSDLVPQIISFKVSTDKIGGIIGTGGKVIKEIIEKTGAMIDIDNNGTVKIYAHPGPKMDMAVSWVRLLGGLIEVGTVYKGIIKRIADFGIFVELVPGVDGLVHISHIPRDKQPRLAKEYPLNAFLTVEVIDYDPETGRIRLKPLEKV